MWASVLALLSYSSGWTKLASVYRSQGAWSGRCFPMHGAKIGDVYYVGCLTIYTSDQGIYLSIWPIFRFRESPLFFPWSEFRNPRERQWLFSRFIQIDIGFPPLGTM